jgi:hypothetical protein
MYLQKYSRLYDYIQEYQQLVYEIYASHAIAFLVTYYNVDIRQTIWDDEKVYGGFYEEVGQLSGVRWRKILTLPVYYIEEIQTPFDGQDIGYVKDNVTNFVIPSTYGFVPYAHDIIHFDQSYLRPRNNIYPVFHVNGIEPSVNTDRRFWKLKVETMQSRTTPEFDNQTVDVFAFSEYDKKIHTLEDAQFLTRLLYKHEEIRNSQKGRFDDNSGFYFS